jgi:NAD(P)-dependent dehydrogenase (short-subunit alcohol dehydrogenase family)
MSGPLAGQVIAVTGGSAGIGKETVRALAGQGAEVVLVVRSRERGEAAMADILRSVPDARLSLVLAELSRPAEVKRAAAELKARWSRLDVLVNNAGALFGQREETADGFEKTFALNHLAYWLMAHELRDRLVASAPARVVSVASDAHVFGRLDLDDLQWQARPYKQLQVYGVSKLCNILFSRELGRRLAGSGVTSNALHPGLIASDFGGGGSGVYRFFLPLLRAFSPGPGSGARTSVWAASTPELAGVTGKYFARRREAKVSAAGRDDALAAGLWTATERLLAPWLGN